MTDEETCRGAKNRAYNARTQFPDAQYWIGIEGGLAVLSDRMDVFAWIFILDHQGVEGLSRTSTFALPPPLMQLINAGVELGEANDIFFHDHNSKQKGGAIGTLTNGVIGRTEYYVQPVMLALIPFLQREIYI